MKQTLMLGAAMALLVSASACDQMNPASSQETPAFTPAPTKEAEAAQPTLPDRASTAESKAAINWDAARADLAALPREERDTSFQVASTDTPPPVPVLLPTGIVRVQGAGNAPRFQPLTDGYYAAYPGVDYDIIVNGTNEVIGKAGATSAASETFLFQPTGSGAMVSFSKYGADYLVEFECNAIEGDEPDCIAEEDAIETARKLIIAGTR